MGIKASEILYYAFHMRELRNIIQWTTWHNAVHERDLEKESPSLQKCYYFLDQTSRSFASVIQELHPELLIPIVTFYLILRGLDTIEDDMTISLDEKDPLLRKFYQITEKEGWTYNGNGPDEKDRELLVQFHNVTEEFRKIKPEYREIINDIAHKMGDGMADFCAKAEKEGDAVTTVADFDLYCHYVAGLVGNGLTRLFIAGGLANPALAKRPELQESMGLFLQKTNIIRDVKEDFDEKRRFWPTEIWSKHVDRFEDLFKPEHKDAALNCSSEMVLNSLNHADQCLFYLAGLKEQSVFNFAAIPQTMAIATLELVFRNPDVFKKNVKITKGDACRCMMQSTQNLRLVCDIFREYTRKIHKKNTPRDPNFLKISIACGKIEQFIESIFPSQSPKALEAAQAANGTATAPSPAKEAETKDQIMTNEAKWDTSMPPALPPLSPKHPSNTPTVYLLLAVFGTLIILSATMVSIAIYFGARFDVAVDELKKGNFKADPARAKEAIENYDRGREL
ncbi:bifunctional farnesyl-diphosphate farnesyltransferase/squalene synthase [Lecanora helva]